MENTKYIKQYCGGPEALGCVAVLYGGDSTEREISLQSGAAILNGLQESGIDAFGFDLTRKSFKNFVDIKCDRVFLAFHGSGGEDGKIQAVLDWLNIPYTGSGVASSALAMDKVNAKRIWQNIGLPTPAFEIIDEKSDWNEVLLRLGGTCFVKPVCEGSSFGMQCVDDPQAIKEAYHQAIQFDKKVIAEKKVFGREFSVAILNEFALPSIELKAENDFYDFDAKYISETTQTICPSELTDGEENLMHKLALDAFEALGCSGWGRVDLMRDNKGTFYLLEVNTVPGMTSHSLVPIVASAAGLSFDELLKEILVSTL